MYFCLCSPFLFLFFSLPTHSLTSSFFSYFHSRHFSVFLFLSQIYFSTSSAFCVD
ncbi:unnamed protein product [Meloidogyne enterolobii]|uniref:Uncharacterized protein n=1 Tax=Meloidogyne enterolobii TaxID=390850 RepID=A0ACB0YF47_MELEN